METNIAFTKAQALSQRLPYTKFECADPKGYEGGVLLLQNEAEEDISIINKSSQAIHGTAKVHFSPYYWILSGIYAGPNFNTRLALSDELCLFSSSCNLP